MCDARSFGHAAQLLPSSPRVVALAEGGNTVTLIRDRCANDSCPNGAELAEERILLPTSRVDQLLLTADGRYLVVLSANRTLRVDLAPSFRSDDERPEDRPPYVISEGPREVMSLVGALRGGRYVVLRDASGLLGYDVELGETTRIGDADMNLLALALGDRHLVARRVIGDGEEELYLVPVAPDARVDELRQGTPVLLTSGERASRVVITRGIDPDDPMGVGRDLQVVVTMGDDPERARSAVFEVSTGQVSDTFDGAIVTSHEPLNDIEGLFPVTPDGKAVPFITPRGSVALHALGGASCLVRSSRIGAHDLAGFSADGHLLFETLERNDEGRKHDRVYLHRLGASEYRALTPGDRSYHLAAVPARPFHDDDGAPMPWAIAAHEGRSYAVQADATPRLLPYEAAAFIPRRRSGFAQDTLWLFEARSIESNDPATRLEMRRLLPVDASGGKIRFELEDDGPLGCGKCECGIGDLLAPFARRYTDPASVCLATSRSDGWARGCRDAQTRRDLVRTRLPATEQP